MVLSSAEAAEDVLDYTPDGHCSGSSVVKWMTDQKVVNPMTPRLPLLGP